MIAVAWHTIRARMSGMLGTFIALALGVALLTMMALTLVSTIGAGGGDPRWYTTPDVVLVGANEVSIVTGSGEDREVASVRTPGNRPLPTDLIAQLSNVDAVVEVDYAGYAVTDGAPGDTVHPWSAAGLHEYAWVVGGAPAAATDIVLSAPTAHRPGDRITVLTARGAVPFTVSGVLRSDAPAALFTVDRVAADLAGGRVAAITLTAKAGSSAATLAERVRAVVSDETVRILTGDGRRGAEPYPDSERLIVTIALLSASCGMAGFVSIFVVAGTFAYAVAARRREFGLLRAAGATPRQVRRLVLGESLVVGVLAAAAGSALGTALAPRFARWLVDTGFAPANFTAQIIFWPVAAAFGAGLLVALTGAWLAARRAGKVRPVEALREAAVDRRTMTLARWVVGLAAIAGVVPMLAVFPSVESDSTVALAINAAMLLIIAFAMFAPLLIPPLVSLLTAPVAAFLGPAGVLAMHSARTAVRRTAATAAPILVTVGIAGATLAAFETLASATVSPAISRGSVCAAATRPGQAGADRSAAMSTPWPPHYPTRDCWYWRGSSTSPTSLTRRPSRSICCSSSTAGPDSQPLAGVCRARAEARDSLTWLPYVKKWHDSASCGPPAPSPPSGPCGAPRAKWLSTPGCLFQSATGGAGGWSQGLRAVRRAVPGQRSGPSAEVWRPGRFRYGYQRQRRRKNGLAPAYGQPCCRCGHLLLPGHEIHLDHDDRDPSGSTYRG